MTPENKSDPSDKSDKSVNTLESLVPPLDLCKQIPEGKLENSALVWTFDDRLMPRTIMIDGVRHYYRGFPAPTLQEILLAIDEAGGYCPSCRYQANTWQVDYEDDPISDESMLPVLVDESDPYNPATAALKLYLNLSYDPSVMSDKSDQSDRSTPGGPAMTIYAIDFDGTIVEEKFPAIGELKPEAADFIHHLQQNGDKWILFTMREEKYLEEALAFLHANGLHPDAVNDNLQEIKDFYHNNPRKVFANFYIDDHNLGGLRFSPYRIGDKLKFAGSLWTVVKTKPGKVLMKGNFCQKWFDIEEIERDLP